MKIQSLLFKKTSLGLVFMLIPLNLYSQPVILVAYHSETGNTEKMAEAVAEGARSFPGSEVRILPVGDIGKEDLITADAIILGSPVYNANVSADMQRFISSWPFEDQPLKDKIGAVFVTGGGISAGEEIVQMNLIQSMLIFGMIIVGGPDWTQPFGASAITDELPFEAESPGTISNYFLERGKKLGQRVAHIAYKFEREKSH